MFGNRLSGRQAAQRRLTPDAVRALVEAFLTEWPPFRERFVHGGAVMVEWPADAQGRGKWIATATPAIDVQCGVVIADDIGQVHEAQLTAMRQGSVLACWPRSRIWLEITARVHGVDVPGCAGICTLSRISGKGRGEGHGC